MTFEITIQQNGPNGRITTIPDAVSVDRDMENLTVIDADGDEHEFFDGAVIGVDLGEVYVVQTVGSPTSVSVYTNLEDALDSVPVEREAFYPEDYPGGYPDDFHPLEEPFELTAEGEDGRWNVEYAITKAVIQP